MMDFETPPRRDPQYIPRAPQPRPSVPQPKIAPQPPQPEPRPLQPASTNPEPATKTKKSKSGFFLKIMIVVSLILIAGAGYFAYNYYNAKKQLNQASSNTPVIGSTETDQLISQISKTVELPSGETPTLSTLKNINNANQTTYLKVQNGDKVLVYNNAGVAVFYRPSLKKVIFFTYLKPDGSTSTNQTTNSSNGSTSTDTIQTNRPGQTTTQQP